MKLFLLAALLCVFITQPTRSQPFLHPYESNQIASHDNIYTNGTDLRYTCTGPAVYMLIPHTGQGYFYDFLKRFEDGRSSPVARLASSVDLYGGYEVALGSWGAIEDERCADVYHRFPNPNNPGLDTPAVDNYGRYRVSRSVGWKDRSLYRIYQTVYDRLSLRWPQNCTNRIIVVLTDRESADVQGGEITPHCDGRDAHPSEVGHVLEETKTHLMVFATPTVLDKWREYSKDFRGRSYIGEFDINNPDKAMVEVAWQIMRHSCNIPV